MLIMIALMIKETTRSSILEIDKNRFFILQSEFEDLLKTISTHEWHSKHIIKRKKNIYI
jgi:hypothetical protein